MGQERILQQKQEFLLPEWIIPNPWGFYGEILCHERMVSIQLEQEMQKERHRITIWSKQTSLWQIEFPAADGNQTLLYTGSSYLERYVKQKERCTEA